MYNLYSKLTHYFIDVKNNYIKMHAILQEANFFCLQFLLTAYSLLINMWTT